MAIINPDFIDVHFPDCPQYTFGAIPAGVFAAKRGDEPYYEDVLPLVPEDEWGDRIREIDDSDTGMDWLVKFILNQGNEGSCVGNAGVQGLMVLDAAENGYDNVIPLSAISCYKQIGSSPNSGAMVDDCLDALTTTGALPLDTSENRAKFGSLVMPATGFYTPYPSGWKILASKLRLVERFVVRSVSGIISALLNGHPVQVGRAGHSILQLRPMYRNRQYGVKSALLTKYINSWGHWGDAGGRHTYGFGYDSLGLIQESAYWAFAFRSLVPNYGKVAA